MSKDFYYLRHWITSEGYSPSFRGRPVILECIRSRSGMSMAVYDRDKAIFRINGYGFDRIGAALGDFLEACFQPELKAWLGSASKHSLGAHQWEGTVRCVGETGIENMILVAAEIGLKVHVADSKAGTLIIIEKGI